MNWEIHPAKANFPKFSEDWDRLNARLYGSHPFFDSRFVGALLDYFARGKERLCILRTDGVVSGALIVQPDGMGRWSLFHPSQTQAAAVLIGDARLLETLFEKLPGFVWTIVIHAIDPRYSPDISQLALPQSTHAHARTIGIQLENGFADYWKKRPKKLMTNLDRYARRAKKELGTLTMAKAIAPGDMDAGVKHFGELETAGWKGAAGTALSSTNQQGAFYRDVLYRFALNGQAAIYELHANNMLASSRLVIFNDQMVVFLKTTYDESLARFAPGRMLLYRVIEEQCTLQSGKTIEFYTNATRDQTEWASFACTIKTIQIFRSPFFANSFAILKVIRRSLRKEAVRGTTPENDLLTPVVKTCRNLEEFSEVQCDVSQIIGHGNLEASLDWFELLRKTVYPSDQGVRYYYVEENNVPTAILPVRLLKSGWLRKVESLSNYYASLFAPLLLKDGDLLSLKQMIATATRDHGGAHVMRFAPMDPESAAYRALLSALRACDWIPLQFFCFGNWFHRVEDNWEDYLRNRGGNLRSSIKRRTKRFSELGGTIDIVTAVDQVEKAIEAFEEIYSASWKRPEPHTQFVPSLIRHLAAQGMLRLGIARLGERTIAAQLWIVARDKASIYKVAYHKDFAPYSPGTVLTAHLFRHVIECDQVKEIDFLIGDDKYKRLWMSDRRERWGIVAYNPRTVIGFALFLTEVSGRTAKLIRDGIRGLLTPSKQRRSIRKKPLDPWSE